ncbi:hypothetical protein [Desulfosarcina sp.]|uniref:hypothetical protein n=1 Tax=Desulfosarcina sp. TaxID=2027861 RepID=UPI0039707065
MKRFSWTELFMDEKQDDSFKKEHLFHLDEIFYDFWSLGRNILLGWAPSPGGLDALVVPHFTIGEAVFAQQPANAAEAAQGRPSAVIPDMLQAIVAGSKMLPLETLHQIARKLDCEPRHVDLPFALGKDLPYRIISSLVKRYSITFVTDRAVALFDVVGFSRHSPLEQAVQLNSLAYSVNTAYSKLLDREIKIRFARTTTGDGFYIWNRDRSLHANIDLYHFMHLVLADNAIARSKTRSHVAPLLRGGFHIGGHYEFYQSEGLNPTTFSYIVGDVTIELARMIEQARPGQILIGDFHVLMPKPPSDQGEKLDAIDFIDHAQERLSSLEGMVLGGEPVAAIKCYITGAGQKDDGYDISKYQLKDKHGFLHQVFNAKVNIHRINGDPIFLGIQNADLSDFGVARWSFKKQSRPLPPSG